MTRSLGAGVFWFWRGRDRGSRAHLGLVGGRFGSEGNAGERPRSAPGSAAAGGWGRRPSERGRAVRAGPWRGASIQAGLTTGAGREAGTHGRVELAPAASATLIGFLKSIIYVFGVICSCLGLDF